MKSIYYESVKRVAHRFAKEKLSSSKIFDFRIYIDSSGQDKKRNTIKTSTASLSLRDLNRVIKDFLRQRDQVLKLGLEIERYVK